MIFPAGHFQEKYKKKQKQTNKQKKKKKTVDLCMTFVAFDTTSRDGFWEIMAMFGCPARFTAMVR